MLKTLVVASVGLATVMSLGHAPSVVRTLRQPNRLAVPATRADPGAGETRAPRAPNRLGRIPILEYHVIGDHEAHWTIEPDHFRRDLQMLYDRGYRPISVSQLIDRQISVSAGMTPVVFTFDDASPSQFRYLEHDGQLEIDPNSAIGIWLDFHAKHPDWENHATFCVLPAASAGHAFFGERGIEGQRSAWRFKKLQFLVQQGFELCDHTLWHANLAKYSDAVVQEQIARGSMAIDSALPGYHIRTFALPLGIWPKNRALARAGTWTDPRSGRVITYRFEAVLEVSGGPTRSPYDPAFDPLRLPRVEVYGTALEHTLDALDSQGSPGARFVAGTAN
jgi:hypothetical protein